MSVVLLKIGEMPLTAGELNQGTVRAGTATDTASL